jgi:integration host factor subunit alpha
MALTTEEMASYITENLGIPLNESQRFVKSTLEIIKEQLTKGNEVKISGFGKWSVQEKRAREGRNSQTGKPLTINARKVVRFKRSQRLQQEMNGGS